MKKLFHTLLGLLFFIQLSSCGKTHQATDGQSTLAAAAVISYASKIMNASDLGDYINSNSVGLNLDDLPCVSGQVVNSGSMEVSSYGEITYIRLKQVFQACRTIDDFCKKTDVEYILNGNLRTVLRSEVGKKEKELSISGNITVRAERDFSCSINLNALLGDVVNIEFDDLTELIHGEICGKSFSEIRELMSLSEDEYCQVISWGL